MTLTRTLVRTVEGNTSFSHNGSLEMLKNHLSILQLNIQSLLPELYLIAAESEAYDLLIFSESWLKVEIKSDSIFIPLLEETGAIDQVRE